MSANAVSWVLDLAWARSRCECPTVTKLSHKWITVEYRDHAVYIVGNCCNIWNMQSDYIILPIVCTFPLDQKDIFLRPLKELQFSNHVACGCTCCDLWIMMAIDGHPCYLSPRKGSQATSQRGQYLFAEVLQMQWRCGLKFLSNRNLKVVSNICTHTYIYIFI